ncbi:MAG: biotin/lipoyl-binding protein [Spirosomaceae bacterium]|nr:biotin/lipoyl-binding protein [Spirosomataceae bacterium]
MIQAKVNDSTYEVKEKSGKLFLGGENFEWDLQQLEEKHFHILKDNKSYRAEVLSADFATKTFQLKINGEIHKVNLKDQTDLLLEKMGLSATADNVMKELKAPMPGLIYELKVAVGDTVQKGDVLLILVAMKMENAIKAVGDGVVKKINVNLNDSVEKGQVMITFE